jgi:signal recognition particle GTPase
MSNFVSQAEFAKLLGKDKSYITRLKQAGRLVMTADGSVDVEKSKSLITETSDPSRNAAETTKNDQQQASAAHNETHIGDSYQTSKAVNEKYKALTAKAEYEKLINKLVDAEEARLFAADLAASFRAALEILPDRLAPELVPLSDTEAVRALLVESFEQVLTDLADKILKWGKAE